MLTSRTRAKLPSIALSGLLCAFVACARTPSAHADPEASTFRLDSAHYLYVSQGLPSTDYESAQLKLQGQAQGSIFEAKGVGEAMLMLTSRDPFYFEAPEAYVGLAPSVGPVRLQLGRKLEEWNRLDELWGLGLWQPRFRWDYFHPEQVGLTGAFVSYERGVFKITGFATPISIPERGVPLDVIDGQLSSPLRWFSPPPASIQFNGTQRPINYDLAMPGIGDLILHPGAGINARLGGRLGWWTAASYAYQPINQPVLSYDGYFTINPASGDSINATVYPRIAYHHLLSLESGYEDPRWSAWLSLLAENPVTDAAPSAWTRQMLAPSRALSAAYDYHWGDSVAPRHLGLSYLRQVGGNLPDSGPFAAPGTSVFESRYPYQSALMLTGGTSIRQWLQLSSKLIYDLGHNGLIWSPEISYSPFRSLALDLGADLLSSGFAGATEVASDFIEQNRVNSRLRGGVTYVF